MKTMNGFTSELLVKKAKRNWRTRCGAFLLAVLASWYSDNTFGAVTLSTNAGGLPNGINFAPTPTPPGAPGRNAGQPGLNAHTDFNWAGVDGNYLNDLIAGFSVHAVDTNNNNAILPNYWTFTTNSHLAFTGPGGGTVILTGDMSWGGNSNFIVEGGMTGNILARGGTLNLGTRLNVGELATLNINADNSAWTTSGVTLSGGTNNGTININQTELTLNGGLGGIGHISIDPRGQLNVNHNNVSQNIVGNYTPNGEARGMVMTNYAGTTNFSGHLSGNVAFSGGGLAQISGNNSIDGGDSPLASLYVLDRTEVTINNQGNLGTGQVTLNNGGGLAKNFGASDFSINNNIVIGQSVNTVAIGMLNSHGTNAVSFKTNADSKLDGGLRFTINGTVESRLPGALIDINYLDSSNGTVVLANNNNNYDGSFWIHRGILEVSSEQNLGGNNNTVQNTIQIGDSTSAYSRSVFRVTGSEGTTETITHWINLETQNSFYEVFTNGAQITEYYDTNGNQVFLQPDPDANGAPVYHDANGVPVTGNVTVQSRPGAMADVGLPDRDRFKVIQAGQVRGNGSLNKSGDGTLVLDVFNAYKGDTNIWHGIVQINNASNINNAKTAKVRVGGEPLMEDNNFRPVFETVIGPKATGSIVIDAGVVINQKNSIIRTTGIGNETIFTNSVTTDFLAGDLGAQVPYPAVLNKDGAGTLTLHGLGVWGRNGGGELNIKQGTVQFKDASNLTSGDIVLGTDWHNYKDIERINGLDGSSILYRAVLKLEDNSDQGIGNRIFLNSPTPGGGDDPKAGSYIEVGTNSVLTLSGGVAENLESNLNKIGKGELVLKSKDNTFSGWTNIQAGTLSTITANNLLNSKGVDLVGVGTIFDMSAAGASQILQGLRGGSDNDPVNSMENPNAPPEEWTRKVLIGDNTLILELANFKANDNSNRSVFYGNIEGTGTLIKKGIPNSTFASGFVGFDGNFDIQTGTLQTLSDTTLTGLTGKVGSYLDILDKTLTINVGANQQYDGTIISSYPALPYPRNATRPHVIKDGAGTLTTSFYDRNINTGAVQSFQGDLTIKNGNIISQSDFYMEGGSNLTFYVNPDLLGSVSPLVLDVSKYSAMFRPGGTTGATYSTVHTNLSNTTTGWTTQTGALTVGKILGNDKSDYTGLAVAETDSLYYTLGLQDVYGTGRHDLYVNLNVTGFGGVGNTYNTKAVGDYLDGARVTNLASNQGLANFIQALWSYGCDVTDESGLAKTVKAPSRLERLTTVHDLFQQLAPDTIANGMFMGLDQPWRVAFDRLNLDSQMVYVAPPQARNQAGQRQYRGQVIANMRNLWFTPTVQSVSARSDGNAKKFGIDRPGYKLGFDKRVAQNTSIGFQLGYSSPKLHEGDDRIEASDFQLGVYGGSMVGNYVELKGFMGFGHQNYKSSRNVAIIPFGVDSPAQYLSSHGRYDGDTFNFSFEVSRPLFLGFSILRPTIGLDSEHAFRYAFTETGSWYASKFERSELSRTRARFGLSMETTTLDRAIFTARLGYSALLGGHDYAKVTSQIVGVNAPMMTVRSVGVGKSFFEAGVGTKIFLNPIKTLALVGNYDATVANRWVEHQALAGFTYLY